MDGTMRYTFGSIDALAGDINARVNAVETRIADMAQQINRLTEIWQGAADEGFQATKQAWVTAGEDLNRVLKNIQIAVTQTNQDAQSTENLNASRWG